MLICDQKSSLDQRCIQDLKTNNYSLKNALSQMFEKYWVLPCKFLNKVSFYYFHYHFI